MRILLIEDNLLTAKGVTYLLEREGYQVVHAGSLVEAKLKLAELSYDLGLIDVTLPDGMGFDFAKDFQAKYPSAPIIFLTARDDEADIVRGLELGADDYVTKPFHNRELLLRIRNRLQPATPVTTITHGVLSYYPARHEAEIGGRIIVLTALESRLLGCLMDNVEHVVPRERLLDEIYSASGKVVNDNTLSVYLKRLRHKLAYPRLIETIKNTGYRLRKLTPENSATSEDTT